jgi:tRNA threonylcarbamoyladenosine biosynthesis protein TsaB
VIVLGLDTCLDACSAAVTDGERVLAARTEPMSRGHQERLAPLVRELMIEAGMAFDALHRVGVTVGPGSFTGLRVGLSFAKGLGAALSIPVIGVGALEAMAAGRAGTVFSVLNAKRDQVYLQAFADGAPLMAPDALSLDLAAARLAELARGSVTLVGSGAPLLADMLPGAEVVEDARIDPVAVARLAAAKPPVPPRPLYLRAPDAKLPGGRDLPA